MAVDTLNVATCIAPPADSVLSVDGFVSSPLDTAMAGEGGGVARHVSLTRGDSLQLGLADTYAEAVETVEAVPPAWMDGIPGTAIERNAGTDSSLLFIISLMLVLMVNSFRHCGNILTNFGHELLNTRQRSNLFEEHTANEHSVVALLAVQLSLSAGILINCIVSGSGAYSLWGVLTFAGVFATAYLMRLCAYAVVGYTFTSRTNMRIWLQGFTASQSLLSIALVVPTLAAIFFPSTTSTMLFLAGILYILAEFVFIIKGFRIFYNKIQSLLYFILYLCTLEIIPVLAVYRISLDLAA